MAETPTDRNTLDFRPIVRQTIVISPMAIETAGEVSLVEVELEGGQTAGPTHIHPGQQERYYVRAGELTVKLGRKKLLIGQGEEIEIPVGAAHTFANRSDAPVTFTAEHRPALRFEEMIRAVHALAVSDEAKGKLGPRTLIRLVRLQSGYPETIQAPPGLPRLMTTGLNGLGRLLGYPGG